MQSISTLCKIDHVRLKIPSSNQSWSAFDQAEPETFNTTRVSSSRKRNLKMLCLCATKKMDASFF